MVRRIVIFMNLDLNHRYSCRVLLGSVAELELGLFSAERSVTGDLPTGINKVSHYCYLLCEELG